VQVPFMFKLAIDWLAALSGTDASLASFTETNATLLALFASPVAVLIGYGIARTGVSACTGKCICFGILCYLVHKSK
jgi:ATP-binding cassette, subfamily B (MDR/TAP), member 7